MNWRQGLLITGILTSGIVSSAREGLSVGIKGGLSIPSLRAGESKNDWNKNYESRVGPYFGASVEIPLSRHWSLQPEINYAAQGGKRNGIQPMTIPAEYLDVFQAAFKTDKDYLFATLRTVSRINYVQIPLLLRGHFALTSNNKLQFFAQAGPFVGYMVAAKQLVNSENLKVYLDAAGDKEIPEVLVHNFFGKSIDTTINAKNDLYRFNTGIQGGVGFSYALGRGKVFIEGGGNYGLIYIQKGDEHGKNNIGAGTILLGYTLGLGKAKPTTAP
jgi:hypothetical protein